MLGIVRKLLDEKGLININAGETIYNADVIFNPGSKICLEEGSVLYIANSNISMEGTSEMPNIFKACKEKGHSINGYCSTYNQL